MNRLEELKKQIFEAEDKAKIKEKLLGYIANSEYIIDRITEMKAFDVLVIASLYRNMGELRKLIQSLEVE